MKAACSFLVPRMRIRYVIHISDVLWHTKATCTLSYEQLAGEMHAESVVM